MAAIRTGTGITGAIIGGAITPFLMYTLPNLSSAERRAQSGVLLSLSTSLEGFFG
jgi:hypothetical protein